MLDINCLTVRSKLTKEELLHSISFSVGEGETFGLIGESGSGKSMTSKCIMRLLNSRAFQIRGEIRWNGRDVFSMNAKELADYRGKSDQYDTAESHDCICSHGEAGKTT